MDPRDDLSAQAWATLREYQEPARYLAPFAGSRPDGARPAGRPSPDVPAGDHPLRAAPSATRRPRGSDPDADSARAYLQHSCDLVLRGGAGAAVTYPLMACALAEHYVVRRVGGSGAAAAAAAAVAAAELGRTRPIDAGTSRRARPEAGAQIPSGRTGDAADHRPGDTPSDMANETRDDTPDDSERVVLPGYAGLARAVAWLAGGDGTERPPDLRLARLLQPSPRMRAPFRLLCALLAPGRERTRAVLAALAGAPTRSGGIAVVLVWAGAVLAWAGITVALLRSPTVDPWVVALLTPALLATVVLAGAAATVLAGVLGLREALAHGPREQYGLVPGVPIADGGVRPGRLGRMLDRFAGVPAPDGSPPVASWLADVLDDLAGLPPRHGLLRDAGVQLPGIDPSTGRALTFGDLWLGRPDRLDGDDERLRRAARDPEHRVVDLRLVATDVTWGRPVRLPLGPGWLFCPSCLRGGVPARAIDQLVAAAPPPRGRHRCPVDRDRLLPVPDAAQVPVVVAVRLAAAPAGLLRAVPLYRADAAAGPQVRDAFGGWWAAGDDPAPADADVTTHWLCDAGADADVGLFDSVLPRWPTFGLVVANGVDAPDDADGPWVDVTPSGAAPHLVPAIGIGRTLDMAAAVLGARTGTGDRVAAAGQGSRGRLGVVRRGRGAGVGPFLDSHEVLRLAMRGHHAGRELRTVFTGADGDVPGQTGTDRHRWLRMRATLREQRDRSVVVASRLPLYGDLAATYRVPGDVAGWFTPPVEAGRVDPAWADAAAALTHLRALTTDGVLDWDTDYGAPPREEP